MPSAAESFPHRGSDAPQRSDDSRSNSNPRRGSASSRWLEARWKSPGTDLGTWIFHRGRSMTPSLRDGDRLCVQSLVGASPPEPGEIIVFRRGDLLVAHRLIAVGEEFVVTRGDASLRDDPPLVRDRLLGRVTRVEPLPSPVRWARRLHSYLIHFGRQ